MKNTLYLLLTVVMLGSGYYLWDSKKLVSDDSDHSTKAILNEVEIQEPAPVSIDSVISDNDSTQGDEVSNVEQEQEESVDIVTNVISNDVQQVLEDATVLKPSELVVELNRVYDLAIKENNEGKVSSETKEYLEKLIVDLKQLPESDLASLIYYGELSAEVFDLANIMLNPKSFLPFQNFINSPLSDVGELSENITQYTIEVGLNFRSSDEDAFDTFMYSQSGNFTGVFSVSPDQDYFEYFLEEIRGVDVSTFGDDISFLVTDIREPVTFFFRGNTVGVHTVELSGVNDSENITSLFLPFSSSTRASVTLRRENDITTVGRWNFDFDGDFVTDISIGNGKEFTYGEYETIFDIMEKDTKLSDLDRTQVQKYRKAVLDFIKKQNS